MTIGSVDDEQSHPDKRQEAQNHSEPLRGAMQEQCAMSVISEVETHEAHLKDLSPLFRLQPFRDFR